MPPYPLTALVLRKTKLGETDTILSLLAEDGRQVRAVAKGLRRPGSKFGARLEPFSVVDLLLNSGRSLEIVSEARTVHAHAGLREDLERSEAAAVVADLLDKVSVEGQHEPRLFALADAVSDTFAVVRSFVIYHVPARLKALDFYAGSFLRT
jgi:DNA repair protein RecO (recombination protein O)